MKLNKCLVNIKIINLKEISISKNIIILYFIKLFITTKHVIYSLIRALLHISFLSDIICNKSYFYIIKEITCSNNNTDVNGRDQQASCLMLS